jgi:hypothetical protein
MTLGGDNLEEKFVTGGCVETVSDRYINPHALE